MLFILANQTLGCERTTQILGSQTQILLLWHSQPHLYTQQVPTIKTFLRDQNVMRAERPVVYLQRVKASDVTRNSTWELRR